jgi:hypothetical protein
MNASSSADWQDGNMRHLVARLAVVRHRLTAAASARASGRGADVQEDGQLDVLERTAADVGGALETPSALDRACRGFTLSTFERDVLLMCAGAELDPEFGALCAAASARRGTVAPTFGLAVAALAKPHWSALTPEGPLRRWRLVEPTPGETLLSSPLRIDERVLHYLLGASYVDERLQHSIEEVRASETLPASYGALVDRITALWSRPAARKPAIHLAGDARSGRRLVAAAVSSLLGARLYALRTSDVPGNGAERTLFTRLWERELVLERNVLLLEADDADDASALRPARTFVATLDAPVFVSADGWLPAAARALVRIDVNRPAAEEQRALWEAALGPAASRLNGQLDEVTTQFHLDADTIETAAAAVRAGGASLDPAAVAPALWSACRVQARAPMNNLAERIECRAGWDDLVIPDEQMQTLHDIVAHVRQRLKVYESWGFASRDSRGLGTTALFVGPSGTGKTLAAEVLAGALRLDLFKIDLSQVVSKYIGETEKNLRAVFAAAERSGAMLLFDEADALFGARAEVRDGHDRYANIEVSYLLQRMEAYAGLAVLTTNQRNALDPAFMRRLRFVVSFPFPDAPQRARIWQRMFPANTPTDGIDVQKLARLALAGGNIRNIALNAAFVAADLGEPIRMSHLLRTARNECAKLERPLAAAEVAGWL